MQSLLERWGINAPFTKAAVLNANSLFYEDELYDILRVTLGFEYGKGKPGKVAVKRYRFAIILNDALNLKMQQVEVLANEKKAKEDAEKARVNAIIQQIEQNHRDSVSKEIEMRKEEAAEKVRSKPEAIGRGPQKSTGTGGYMVYLVHFNSQGMNHLKLYDIVPKLFQTYRQYLLYQWQIPALIFSTRPLPVRWLHRIK